MCGIFACLCSADGGQGGKGCIKECVLGSLQRRGPDCLHQVCVPVADGGLQLELLGTLLSMRGEPTPLPLGNEAGDWLLWNGNVFGGGIQISPGENDTVKVLQELSFAPTHSALLETLGSIHGPWAFVFWQASSQSLWFGRDVFGRRSLLWHLPHSPDDPLVLSSVGHFDPSQSPPDYWLEVPAVGIYRLSCTGIKTLESGYYTTYLATLECYLWKQGESTFQSKQVITDELNSLKTCLDITPISGDVPAVLFPLINTSTDLEPHPHPLAHSNTPGKDTHDAETLLLANSVATVDSPSTTHPQVVTKGPQYTSYPLTLSSGEHVQRFMEVLQGAVQRRVSRAPPVRGKRQTTKVHTTDVAKLRDGTRTEGATWASGEGEGALEGNAGVAVLFSGGVDSAVLAALVDRCLGPDEEIDLINVAFEQKHLPESDPNRFNVPDRISGLACLQELNQERKWNFIMVNVTLDEVNKMRREVISQLVYPLNTVLDDSIGCSLWFSSRGLGLLHSSSNSQSTSDPGTRLYKSSARTLLVGIGADEQLAGYARHRTKFRTHGIAGVIKEVEMDIKRLAKRNFGRDDRCAADHQRDAQYPFLDEQVVAYLQGLPMILKADLSLPRGVGEKRLLREVAALLHCHTASAQPKRAIQFGSRMAKLSGSSNNRERGTDTCERLLLSKSVND